MVKLKDIGEFKLVELFKKRYKTRGHTLAGIGDDSAVIRAPIGKNLLLFTCDTLVEGIHFKKKECGGYKIGWKAMGAGLSDIAAMGGVPISAVVSLGMPPETKINFVKELIRGINNLSNRFNVDVVGGDTVSSPEGIVITIAVVGKVRKKDLVFRNGAKPGDKILVTGKLGGSIFGKQFTFLPRIKEAQWLVRNAKINAMMDITDGLSIDLNRLITESNVGAVLHKELIPISKDAYKTKNPLLSALTDGEDFELLITSKDINRLMSNKKYPLAVIGEITKEKGVIKLIDKYGRIENLKPKGYEHFKR